MLFAATTLVFDVGTPVARAQDEPAPQPKPAAPPSPTGQVSRSKRQATSSQAALLVLCELDCTWKLDGEDRGTILANGSAKARVDLGEHVLTVATTDGKDQIEQQLDLKSTVQKIVNAKLAAVRSARLDRESAEKAASEEQRKTLASTGNGSGEQTLFDTSRIRLLVRGSPNYLDFELHVRPTDSPMLYFDVNKNNAVDANVDVGYGEEINGGACTVYRLDATTSTDCRVFHSEATLATRSGDEAGLPIKIMVWHIPKKEINAENGDAHLTVRLYDSATRQGSYFPSKDFSQTFQTLLTAKDIREETVFATSRLRLLVRGSPDYLDFELHISPHRHSESQLRCEQKQHCRRPCGRRLYGGQGEPVHDLLAERYVYHELWRVFTAKQRLQIRQETDAGVPTKILVWHIPKKEINAENGGAHLIVFLWNEAKEFSFFPSQDFSQTFQTLLQ